SAALQPPRAPPAEAGGDQHQQAHGEPEPGHAPLGERAKRNGGDSGHARLAPETGTGGDGLSPPAILVKLPVSSSRRRDLPDAVALRPLALELARAPDRGGPLAGALLRRLLVMTAELDLAIDALTLQLLLERPQRLVDIVIANDDLHKCSPLFLSFELHENRYGR